MVSVFEDLVAVGRVVSGQRMIRHLKMFILLTTSHHPIA
jgi:hypothetical protein